MALTVGELVAYLRLDDKDFSTSLDRAGKSMQRAGGIMTAAVTLPIVGGLALAVKGASDLEESVNKVDVVFGKSAENVRKWSEGSAEAMGQSKAQALEAAGTFGNLFVAMGTGEDEAAKMSTSLVELASDLASFNNTTVDEALLALRSGMVGETEPLKRFGVAMNEATLKAEAMALGLDTTGATLDPLVKQQAAYSLIMKQTTTAQGDFARTSDGLANSTKIASAELKDLAATLGKDLIPMAKDLLGIIKPILSTFSGMPGPIRKVGLGFALLAAATGPVLLVTGSLMRAYGGIITQGPKLISTLGRFAGGFRDARVATSGFSGAAGTLGGKMRGVVTAVGNALVASGKWIAKIPQLIAQNTALAASYTAVGVAIAATSYAVYEAVKAFQDMWQAENDLLAQKDATLAAERAFEQMLAEKYGRGSAKYEKNMAGAGMASGVGQFDSGYGWGWSSPIGPIYDKIRGFANEGVVKATPGGTVVRVAEGGEDEAIVKTSRLKGRSIVVNLNFNAPVVGGKAGLRELSRMVQGDVMAGVQRGMVGQNG